VVKGKNALLQFCYNCMLVFYHNYRRPCGEYGSYLPHGYTKKEPHRSEALLLLIKWTGSSFALAVSSTYICDYSYDLLVQDPILLASAED
jgi:hypothetical protein